MSEEERLRILAEFEILDTQPEKEFDDIVELASALYAVPMCCITLLDSYRSWFKAKVGMDGNSAQRKDAFCHYAIEEPDKVLVVNDSTKDERFKDNPFTTGESHVRFYAGAPLITKEGVALGTLCVVDTKPRTITDTEERMLQTMANRVVRLLEMRRENLKQKKVIESAQDKLDITLTRFMEAQQTAHIGNWDFNVRTQELYWSPEMFRLLLKEEAKSDKGNLAEWQALIHPEDRQIVQQAMERSLTTRQATSAEFRILSKGVETWLLGRADLKYNSQGKIERIYGTLQDISERKQAEKARAHYTHMLEETLFDVSHKLRKPITTVMGLLPVLNTKGMSMEKFGEVYEHFLTSINELEGYTREINDRLHKSKRHIGNEGMNARNVAA
ncbi:MAG: GAF domain-containing protein [Chitinophagales bacterium]|nr:GAF domain-containing protein [Chitinophagales bacterium]